MSRHEYPDENWLNDYSRRGQQWIHDKFVANGDLEDFFPESVPYWLEVGFRLSDLNRAFDEAKNARMGIEELVKIADHHLQQARDKEAAGHLESAFEYYQRASLAYLRGSWSQLDADSPDKQDWHNRGLDAFDKVIELCPYYDLDKVYIELPSHEAEMAAIFHKCGERNAPTILYVPGMDVSKEEVLDPANNRFGQRGMNVLVIDGPGQGETRLNGVCDEEYDTYQKAGRAAIDWLVDQPEVDDTKIGVSGLSMGTYWGPRIAYEDDRVAALCTHMGCQYSKDILFNQAQPFFKKRFMYMAGIYDEDEFDDYMADQTLHGIAEEITCPTLIMQGEYDELQVREQIKLFFEAVSGPKRLQLYENEFHPMGNVAPDVVCDIADWFRDVWDGEFGAGDEEAEFVPDYPEGSYIPSPQFEFLEQDERPS